MKFRTTVVACLVALMSVVVTGCTAGTVVKSSEKDGTVTVSISSSTWRSDKGSILESARNIARKTCTLQSRDKNAVQSALGTLSQLLGVVKGVSSLSPKYQAVWTAKCD